MERAHVVPALILIDKNLPERGDFYQLNSPTIGVPDGNGVVVGNGLRAKLTYGQLNSCGAKLATPVIRRI